MKVCMVDIGHGYAKCPALGRPAAGERMAGMCKISEPRRGVYANQYMA